MRSKDVYTEERTEKWLAEKFAVPSVKKGTVFEYRYKIRSPFIYEIPKWKMQYDIPCDNSELTVEIPEYFNYKTRTTGFTPLEVDESSKTGNIIFTGSVSNGIGASAGRRSVSDKVSYQTTVTTYQATNIPSLKDEDFVYHMDSYRSSIVFELIYTKFPSSTVEYYSSSWNSIAENLQDNPRFGSKLNSKVKSTNALLESVANKSDGLCCMNIL